MGKHPTRYRDHQADVWKKLSERLGGEFVDQKGWRHDRVCVEQGGWTVTLDFGAHPGYRLSSIYTRLRAPCASEGDFHFRIFHQELVDGIARLLGMQDVRIGDPAFDKAFVVQGSDEAKLKAMLSDAELRKALLAEPHVEVTLRKAEESLVDDDPGVTWELCVEVPGRVEDERRLEALYDLFSGLLHQLCRLSSAYPPEAGPAK
jgi:hypothetical protein